MKKDKKVIIRVFLIRAALVFAAWLILYYGFLLPDGRLNGLLTELVLNSVEAGLGLLGYEASTSGSLVLVNREALVRIEHGCNGLELYALYAGFLLSFPGRWKHKLIFIPAGVLLIFFINVIRNMALALNYKFFQQTFDFNHKYTYVLIVYLCVFLLWRFWMNRYSVIAERQ